MIHARSIDVEDYFQVLNMQHLIDRADWDGFSLRCGDATRRILDLLEQRYSDFSGLNLTDETREGILKHGCHWPHPVRLPDLGRQRSLEAQAADLSDEIAYMNHDLDDALRAGLIDLAELGSCHQPPSDLVVWLEPESRSLSLRSQAPQGGPKVELQVDLAS